MSQDKLTSRLQTDFHGALPNFHWQQQASSGICSRLSGVDRLASRAFFRHPATYNLQTFWDNDCSIGRLPEQHRSYEGHWETSRGRSRLSGWLEDFQPVIGRIPGQPLDSRDIGRLPGQQLIASRDIGRLPGQQVASRDLADCQRLWQTFRRHWRCCQTAETFVGLPGT